LQNGQISFDRRTKDTSVEELTSLVVREYRAARDKVLRPPTQAWDGSTKGPIC
jgi:hypothetical protein